VLIDVMMMIDSAVCSAIVAYTATTSTFTRRWISPTSTLSTFVCVTALCARSILLIGIIASLYVELHVSSYCVDSFSFYYSITFVCAHARLTNDAKSFYNRTPVNKKLTRCARSHCKRGVYASVHCKLPHAFTGHSTSEHDGSNKTSTSRDKCSGTNSSENEWKCHAQLETSSIRQVSRHNKSRRNYFARNDTITTSHKHCNHYR